MSQIGFPGAVLIAIHPAWSSSGGKEIEEVYAGNEPSIVALGAQLQGNVLSFRQEGEGRVKRLIVRKAADNAEEGAELTTEVRLSRNRISKSIYDSVAFDAVSDEDRQIIRKAIETGNDSEIDTLTGDAELLYGLLLKGVTDFMRSQPVVNRTVTASAFYGFTDPTAEPDTIYSTAQLIPALNGLIDDDLLPNNVSSDTTKTYGWFYHGAEIVGTSSGRKQMVQEWEWGLWDVITNTFAF